MPSPISAVQPSATAATAADVPALLTLRDEAMERQRTRGVQQWRADPEAGDRYLTAIDSGELWVVRAPGGGVPLAATMLLHEDEPTWGALGRDGTATYVHGLMSGRRPAGWPPLGSWLLRWAGEHTAGTGRALLRLDCIATNPVLRRFYLDQGFHERGITAFDPRIKPYHVRLFERPVGPGRLASAG